MGECVPTIDQNSTSCYLMTSEGIMTEANSFLMMVSMVADNLVCWMTNREPQRHICLTAFLYCSLSCCKSLEEMPVKESCVTFELAVDRFGAFPLPEEMHKLERVCLKETRESSLK